MKATGIVRRFDDLGRINIPKEIRRGIFKTESAEGKPMEIFIDGDSIVLRKYEDAETRKEKEIREKVISEFAERLHDLCGVEIGIYQYTDLLHESRIDEIAEELRGSE